jgi:hypothetical protein
MASMERQLLRGRVMRANALCDFLFATFGLPRGHTQTTDDCKPYVLDVAGGDGATALTLITRGSLRCGVVDPRCQDLGKAARSLQLTPAQLPDRFPELFRAEDDHDSQALLAAKRDCALLVGFHPDQAAEPIIDFCLARGKPFAVAPCCVFPREFPHRRVDESADASASGLGFRRGKTPRQPRRVPVETHEQFVRYLRSKAPPGFIQTATLRFEGHNTVLYVTGK